VWSFATCARFTLSRVRAASTRRRQPLTEAGESLLVHAEAICARLDAAMEELRSRADGLSGSVRVGCLQTMARHVVPGLVRRISRRSPHVELHLRESDCDLELQRQVACGDLDIAFVVTPVKDFKAKYGGAQPEPYAIYGSRQ
jgi:DNA-binding transcriptional LysR family regulator